MGARDGFDALPGFMTSFHFLLFFPGPGRECLGVPLASLRNDFFTIVASATAQRAETLSSRRGRRLAGVDDMSQGRERAAQPFEERAQLIRVGQRDRAYVLGFFSVGLLPNHQPAVFRVGNKNDRVIPPADADLMSFGNVRHDSPFAPFKTVDLFLQFVQRSA
jgi:hypothetical protein